MPSKSTAVCCALLFVGLGVALVQFENRSAAAAQVPSPLGATSVVPTISVTIPLAAVDDVRRLDQRPEIAEVLLAARTFSDAPIFVEAYVTADDARYQADASGVSVADQLVIEVGGYLATQGVEADRISGKGMGIDPAIGRAVVVSFGIAEPPSVGA